MKNKLVKIHTIYDEHILCIILKETKVSFMIKNDFSQGHIYKEDIKEIEIIGDVVNE